MFVNNFHFGVDKKTVEISALLCTLQTGDSFLMMMCLLD